MSLLAPTLQAYFTERLITQRDSSLVCVRLRATHRRSNQSASGSLSGLSRSER